MTFTNRWRYLFVATSVCSVVLGGCGSGTTSGASLDAGADSNSASGLPPGASCVVDADAGDMVATLCQDNPALPTCFQCVDLTSDGEVNGVCAYTCRIGEQDCPSGQTCVSAGVSSRTGYQDCRDLTDGYELGYCQ